MIAFKEWDIVCKALEEGRQSLILRKGGIHEGREGFSFNLLQPYERSSFGHRH